MSTRWTVLFYSPIFMLAVRGAAPAAAGSILIPTNIGFGVGGVLVGWLHVRRDGAFWLPSIISLCLFAGSLYGLSLSASPEPSVMLFILAVLVNGLTTGAGVNYTLAHTLHLSHDDIRYVSTSLLATFRGFGGSFGTAIGGGIFYRLLRDKLVSGYLELDGGTALAPERRRLISSLAGTPGLVFGGGLNESERQVAIQGYAAASSGVWRAAALVGLGVVIVQAATGWVGADEKDGVDEIDEEEARAIVTEHEGIGEA